MTLNVQSNREKEIFEQALEYPIVAERDAFLKRSCGNDQGLHARVSSLLRSHESCRFLPDVPSCSIWGETVLAEQLGERIGRYRLARVLGEGGCGVVYVAEQEQPVRRQVALKVIKPGMDTKSVLARFDAERQALAMMDHPHIAKVLDGGATESGRPFFVMELVDGLPITEFCDKHKLPVGKRLELFVHVCHAVQHAHQKGVLHRDLKPSNILVANQDGVPVPKVIDFGIAKALEGRLGNFTVQTELRHFLGTPAYISPEQAQPGASDIDTRADIYSLGTVLYELLTGTSPFDTKKMTGSDLEEVRRVLRDVEPHSPSMRFAQLASETKTAEAINRATHPGGLQARLQGDLDSISLKCLEKDRARRYDTANALGMDIQRHLNQEPVLATPPSTVYRVQKFVRRNRSAVWVGGLAVFLLLAAVVGTSIGFVRAERAARALDQNLYIHRIAFAHRQLTEDPPNISDAERILEDCPLSLRGWEWNFLKRQWLEEPRILVDPAGRGFSSVALARNGALIATAGQDGFLRIWDAETGKVLKSIPAHTNGFSVCVVFDPKNPERLVSAGSDKLIKLWDWRNGKILHSWPLHFSFEQGLAYSVAFSPDGQRIAAASVFDKIKIWSSVSGEELSSFSGHLAAAFSLTFSPDGRDLAVGCSDGLVRVWNTAREREAPRSFGAKGDPLVACVAYDADGERLGAANFEGGVRVWHTDSGIPLLNFTAHNHNTYAVALSFSPDGKRLATAGHDRSVRLWDAKSGQQMLAIRDFTKEARSIQFSGDGMRLFGASLDGTVRIWDATPLRGTEGKGLRTVSIPTSALGGMEVTPDGSLLLASGGRKLPTPNAPVPIYLLDIASGSQTEMNTDYSGFIFSLSLSPDRRFVATVGDDTGPDEEFVAKVWDLRTRKPVFTTEGVPGIGVLFSLSYSPNGKFLIASGHEGKIIVWDAGTGRVVGILGEHARGRTIFHLTFSANGKYLATISQDGNVRVWDATQLNHPHSPVADFQAATPDNSDSLAFSADGTRLVTARDDNSAVIRDVESERELLVLKTERRHGFRSVAYSSDGKWIASGGGDSSVKLWNAVTGELVRTFAGHRGEVIRLRFASTGDGLRVISGSRDCTLKIWDAESAILKETADSPIPKQPN